MSETNPAYCPLCDVKTKPPHCMVAECPHAELTIDHPDVIKFIEFLDDFDQRIEAHKRALCAHYPAAVADSAIGRRLQNSLKTVIGMRMGVTALRAEIQSTHAMGYDVICERLTELLKIGV